MPHIHKLIDFTVTPIVLSPDKKRVLLVNHPKYGSWMYIGGHIELDENPDQALYREIKEECGLEVEVMEVKDNVSDDTFEGLLRPRFVNIHDANAPHRHIGLVYFCVAKTADFIKSDEHTDMAWFSKDDIEHHREKITKLTYHYSNIALEELGDGRK